MEVSAAIIAEPCNSIFTSIEFFVFLEYLFQALYSAKMMCEVAKYKVLYCNNR